MEEAYPRVYLYRRIVQAKLFIDAKYSEKIDLENISDEACFSKFHFIRLFKSIYGRTPHQYLKYVRIEQSKELLKLETSVTDTCFSVGFESVPTFSSLFTKMVGQSPSNFLNQHKLEKSQKSAKPIAYVPSCFAAQHGWFENSNFE